MLIDSQELIREGLSQLLSAQEGMHVVGSAAAWNDAAAARCREAGAEVILIGWRVPGFRGAHVLERISHDVPGARPIVIAEADDVSAEQAITSGAWGYIGKNAGLAELHRAVRAVAAGELWCSRVVLTRLVKPFPKAPRRRKRTAAISAREAEVLRLVAAGYSNEQIAERLYVEVSTVKTHLMRAFKKLEVQDRTAAVLAAMSCGFL